MGEAGESPVPLVKAPLKPSQEHCQPQAHPLSLLGSGIAALLGPVTPSSQAPPQSGKLLGLLHLLGGQSLFHPLCKQYLLGILSGPGRGGEPKVRNAALEPEEKATSRPAWQEQADPF